MSTLDKTRSKTISASIKTLDIVEALKELDGAGVTEIAEELDMSKSSVYFHLSTLRSKGFVVQEDSDYRLGMRFANFGGYVKRTQPLYDVVKPAVDELANEIGEPAYCHIEEHGLATTLYVSKQQSGMDSVLKSGTQSRMHYTAAGKAILAHLSRNRVREIIDRWELPAATEHTITDSDALFRDLESGRECGYFETREEFKQGLSALAVPIIKDKTVMGAVSIGAPEKRMRDLLDDDKLPNTLMSTANMIEVNISFS